MKTLVILLTGFLFSPINLFSQPFFQKQTTGPVPTTLNHSHSSAWGDYDNDGDQDLVVTSFNDYCTSCTYPILFYKNMGDGVFTRIYDNSIASYNGISSGLSWGDYDNDGWLDLFICGHVNAKNMLFHNEGNGNFTRITEGEIVNDIGWCQNCSWIDFDKDGWLDIFVTDRNPNHGNLLYKNNGNGEFTKITSGNLVTDIAASRNCSWGDYDNDGWQDLFVLNYEGQNDFLYHNNGNGLFTRIYNVPMVNDGQWGSSCSWIDYNNDGRLDLYVTNNGSNNKLYVNQGSGNFVVSNSLLSQEGNSYGFSWGDYDNDGLIDLSVTNYSRNNTLYKNVGNSVFTKVTNEIVSQEGPYSLTSAWSDYNNDGKLDLLLTNTNGTLYNYLYKNTGTTGNYIICKLEGCYSNRSGIGAKIKIYKNDFFAMKVISGGDVYAQSMLWAHFGIGERTSIDSIVVEWPYSDSRSVYENITVNQTILLSECTANTGVKNEISTPENFRLLQNYPNPFNPATTINYEISENSFVKLGIYDIKGREVSLLVNKYQTSGKYEIEFNSDQIKGGLSSGIYFYKITAGNFTSTQKMILSK